jgi:DNA-binding NarL/FixJ family response regulator
MSDIRLVVTDDHPLFREGVIHSLNSEPEFSVVGEAGSGEEAYQRVAEQMPDVLLMDITMPGIGGIEAARRIAQDFPAVQIVMLTVSENEDDLMGALKAGARGYLLKGAAAQEVANAVRTVASGGVYVTPALASGILFEMTHSEQTAPDPINELSEREREILSLVAEGLTNREIGDRLHLAEKTVKHYMTNVLQKLQVRTRVEAALLAQERRLRGEDL